MNYNGKRTKKNVYPVDEISTEDAAKYLTEIIEKYYNTENVNEELCEIADKIEDGHLVYVAHKREFMDYNNQSMIYPKKYITV